MSKADDTRRRILDAATTEFAERGIAGARVDRIVAAAAASKPMLYTYFGSKDELFDAVFTDRVIGNVDRVPFTAADLPAYAVRLYDDYLADPFLLRLVAWRRLERVPTGYLFEGLEAHDESNLADIAREQRRGTIRGDLDATDVWSLLIALASSWAQVSITEVAKGADPAESHARRRTALSSVVSSGLCASGAS